PVQDDVPAQAYGSECDANIGQSLVTKTVVIPNYVIGDVKLTVDFSTATAEGNGAYVKFNGIPYDASTNGEELTGSRREYNLNLSPGTYTLEVFEGRMGLPANSGYAVSCPFTTGYVSWFVPGPPVNTEVTEYLGGLRVAYIKNYDGLQTEPTSQRYFEYENINVLRPYRTEAYKQFHLSPSYAVNLRLSTAEYFNNNLDNRPTVEYGTITEYSTDKQGVRLGKTVYEYNTHSPQRMLGGGIEGLTPFKHSQNTGANLFYGIRDVMQDDDFTYWRSDGWKYGTLAHKHVYKNTAAERNPVYVKLQQLDNTYSTLVESEIKSNYVFANIPTPETFDGQYSSSFSNPYNESNDAASYVFSYYVAKKSIGKKVMDSIISTTYDEDGLNPVITTTDYVYGNTAHQQPTLVKTTNSMGQVQETITSYPDDVTGTSSLSGPDLTPLEKNLIDGLKTTGAVHRPMEAVQVESVTKDTNGNVLSGIVQRTVYEDWDINQILPKSIKTMKEDFDVNNEPMEERITYHDYDSYGNPVKVSKAGGPQTYYVWGYKGSQPIVKIDHLEDSQLAALQSVFDAAVLASNEDNDRTQDSSGKEGALRTALEAIRNHSALTNALVTTYTHD
ncbi:MAG: hypothetical protein AB3N10_03540, partial [Allomuricauda sp.]